MFLTIPCTVPPEVVPTSSVQGSSTMVLIQSTSVSSVDSTTIVILPTSILNDTLLKPPSEPVIIVQSTDQANPTRIATGSDVRLICTTDDLAKISWGYGFGELPANAVVTEINNLRSELNITNFGVATNTGPYICTAEAGNRTNSTSVVLVPTGMLSIIGCIDSPAWQHSVE